MDNGIMAMSITSSGLDRIPSHAEKIIEKPTSKPISSASRNAMNRSASTSDLDLSWPGELVAAEANNQSQPDVDHHHDRRDEHTGHGNGGGEYGSEQHLIVTDHDQTPGSWNHYHQQHQHQRVERELEHEAHF